MINYRLYDQISVCPQLARPSKGEIRSVLYDRHFDVEATTEGTKKTVYLTDNAHLYNQQSFGCCYGETMALVLSRLFGWTVSGRHLWVEGRRHAKDLTGKDHGTTITDILFALYNVGATELDPTETDDTPKNWDIATFGEPLPGALEAYDNKLAPGALKVSFIGPESLNLHESVLSAISRIGNGVLGVVFASGLKDKFFDLKDGEVATSEHLGGWADGHAQSFGGCDLETGELFVDNSWGEFAGLRIEKAKHPEKPNRPVVNETETHWIIPGSYRMAPEVLRGLWEIYVIEVA